MFRTSRVVSLMLLTGVVGFALVGVADGQDKKSPPKKEAPIVPPLKGESKSFDLFDGKSLAGWEGFEDLWSVKDGVIIGHNEKPVSPSTYLLTKEKFSDFRLICEFKLAPGSEMHSGIAFWGKVDTNGIHKQIKVDPAKAKYTYEGHLVMFPSSWGIVRSLPPATVVLPVDGGPGIKINKQHDWNHIEILAQGNRVRVAGNEVAIVDWRDTQPELISEGPIGLQLHELGQPQTVEFKNLHIETFPREDRLITVKEAK